MKISRFTMNPFGMNCYILWSGPGGQCIVIDPGMMLDSEKDMITSFIDGNNLTVKHVLLTHCHIDHACAARWLATKYGVPVEAGAQEDIIAEQMPTQAARFGLKIDSTTRATDRTHADDDDIDFACEAVRMRSNPGHPPA